MERIVKLEIDGKEVKAREGMTILEAAKETGVEIPNLCYHEKLLPYGACRICSVEIRTRDRTRIVAACGFPVEENLIVKTRTPRIDEIRRTIIELIAPLVGKISGEVDKLAREYGADVSKFSRFIAKPTNCFRCGICVRYCSEIVGANAVGFVGRGIDRQIVFFPEIASGICMSCRKCFELCPTGRIPSITDGVCFEDLTPRDVFCKRGALSENQTS